MPRGNQPARQWRLQQFPSRPPGLAVEDTARELGCAVRTVWSDSSAFEKIRALFHVGSGTTFGLERYRIQPDGAGDGRCA
jgi:hypothetical protein